MNFFLIYFIFLSLFVGLSARPKNVPEDAKYDEKDKKYILIQKQDEKQIITIWDKNGDLDSINQSYQAYSDVVFFHQNRWYARNLRDRNFSVPTKELPPEHKPSSVPTEAVFNFDLKKWELGKIKNGKKNGIWQLWWVEGENGGTVEYRDGLYHGQLKLNWENGKTREKVLYLNNLKTGKFLTYYESGVLEEESDFKEGKRNGLRVKYSEEGKMLFRDTFREGKRIKGETFEKGQ